MTPGALLDQTRVCTAALAGLMVAESCRVWAGLRMVVGGALIETLATLTSPVAAVEAVRESAKVAVIVETPLPTAVWGEWEDGSREGWEERGGREVSMREGSFYFSPLV